MPDIPWQITSTPIAHGEQLIGTLSGDGRLRGTVVQVDRLRVEQGPGTADGSGRYDYESGAYTAALRGTGLRLGRPFVPETLGTLAVDVQFDGSGTLDAPAGAGFIRIVPEGGRIADLVGAAETRLQLEGGRVQTRTFVPKLQAFVDASVAPRAPYDVRGTAVVNRLDVESLALAAGAIEGTVSGTVTFSAAFEGQLSDTSSLSAFVNLQDVAMSAGGVPVRLEWPARIEARANDFSRRRSVAPGRPGHAHRQGPLPRSRRRAAERRVHRSARRPRRPGAGGRPGHGRQRLRGHHRDVGEPRRPRPGHRHRQGQQRPDRLGRAARRFEGSTPRRASTAACSSSTT